MELQVIQVSTLRDRASVFETIRRQGDEIGISELRQMQLLTAASELITNIIKNAGRGEIRIEVAEKDGTKCLVVTAIWVGSKNEVYRYDEQSFTDFKNSEGQE